MPVHRGCVKGFVFPTGEEPVEDSVKPKKRQEPKTCVVCGAELPKGKKKFCSNRCLVAARDMERGALERRCAECGGEMPSWRKRYCSDECQARARKRRSEARAASSGSATNRRRDLSNLDAESAWIVENYAKGAVEEVLEAFERTFGKPISKRSLYARAYYLGIRREKAGKAVVRGDGVRYETMTQAAKENGCSVSMISAAIRRGSKSLGHRWSFADEKGR